jgi:hypothetical protein
MVQGLREPREGMDEPLFARSQRTCSTRKTYPLHSRVDFPVRFISLEELGVVGGKPRVATRFGIRSGGWRGKVRSLDFARTGSDWVSRYWKYSGRFPKFQSEPNSSRNLLPFHRRVPSRPQSGSPSSAYRSLSTGLHVIVRIAAQCQGESVSAFSAGASYFSWALGRCPAPHRRRLDRCTATT